MNRQLIDASIGPRRGTRHRDRWHRASAAVRRLGFRRSPGLRERYDRLYEIAGELIDHCDALRLAASEIRDLSPSAADALDRDRSRAERDFNRTCEILWDIRSELKRRGESLPRLTYRQRVR